MATKKDVLLDSAGLGELEIIEFYIEEAVPEGAPAKLGYFGVNVAKVLEVIESPQLKPSASATHPCFMGTIPLREKILPVLDLSVWLGLERKKTAHEVILVTEFHKRITGFLVSGVTQIYRVAWNNVEAPSRYLSAQASNCVTGMVKLEEHFVLLLDFETIIAELDPDYSQASMKDIPKAERRYRALVAEDSSTMRHAMKNILESANFSVDLSINGVEAWNKVLEIKEKAGQEKKAFREYVDIVVSDIEMPQMDGYTLTSKIKGDPDIKETPVILFSSIVADDLRHKGEAVKADDQVTKPEFNTLADRAIKLIQRREGASA